MLRLSSNVTSLEARSTKVSSLGSRCLYDCELFSEIGRKAAQSPERLHISCLILQSSYLLETVRDNEVEMMQTGFFLPLLPAVIVAKKPS